jgi:hypothetical protein
VTPLLPVTLANANVLQKDTTLNMLYPIDKVSYVDSLGFHHVLGESIIMECSSGPFKENIEHTKDDTKKLIRSGYEVLKAQQSEFLDASFVTFTQRQVLTIQTVKDVMTLTSSSVTPQEMFEVIELRTAQLPISWT